MKLTIDKDCILWKLNNEFTLFYLWWGLEPWREMTGSNKRIFEFGIGYKSWVLFTI